MCVQQCTGKSSVRWFVVWDGTLDMFMWLFCPNILHYVRALGERESRAKVTVGPGQGRVQALQNMLAVCGCVCVCAS